MIHPLGRRGGAALLLAALVAASIACSDGDDDINPCAARPAPLASAGADQLVTPGTRVDLSAEASAAPGAVLAYAWRLSARPPGSNATLSAPNAVDTSFLADVAGTYVALLTVSDGCAESEPDVVVVTAASPVTPPTTCGGVPPPIANAGADRAVGLNELVWLDGSGSTTSRGVGLTYRWTLQTRPAGSLATLGNPFTSTPALRADVAGAYVVALVVNDGCADSAADTVTLTAANRAPVASAGADRTVPTGGAVTVTGAGSGDPDGDALIYEWTLTSRPAASAATLPGGTDAARTFTPDVDGQYVLTLVVSDGSLQSAPDTVTLTAVNVAPVANAGGDLAANAGGTVALDGSASVDPNGSALSYAWTLAVPQESAASLAGGTTATPTFVADVEGTYVATLVVSDGTLSSAADTVEITVHPKVTLLARHVVDAEYSRARDRIVMVSSGPNELAILDPVSGVETTVALPLPPTCVGVSPDGNFAAAGHNAYVSYVDLATGTLVKTLATSADVFDVVLAGNGYVYAFPRVDQWTSIRTIHIETGVETLSQGIFRAGTKAKLHPSGTSIYGANNGLSPSDIEKYDISSGNARVLYDSPYHGDYAMCGDLWISEDGARIFTRCGNVFRSSALQVDDMRYAGSLAPPGTTLAVRWVEDSVAANAIAVLEDVWWQGGDATKLHLHERAYMARTATVTLPKVAVGGRAFVASGRFVFHRADGSERYVLLQVDPASGLLDDYVLFVH